MNGWMILLLVLLILFLVGQIRLGVLAEYSADGPGVWIRAAFLRFQVYPLPAKDPSKKKQKKKSKPKDTSEKPKLTLGGKFELAKEFLPLILEAAGCFWKRLVMDELELRLTVGCPDPADCAVRYGQAHAALGAMWVPLNEAFHVKNGRGHVDVDFETDHMTLYAKTALSMKIGQILFLGLWFAIKALKRFLRFRKYQKENAQMRKAV